MKEEKKIERLTFAYFTSWQEPADFDQLVSMLSNEVTIDAGFFKFTNKHLFRAFLETNSNPWTNVKLLSAIYKIKEASIIYEGINKANNCRMRVSEHLRFNDKDQIESILTVISAIK